MRIRTGWGVNHNNEIRLAMAWQRATLAMAWQRMYCQAKKPYS